MEFSLTCFTNTGFARYLKGEGAHETFHKPKWLKSEEAIILMQNKSRGSTDVHRHSSKLRQLMLRMLSVIPAGVCQCRTHCLGC